MTSGIISDSIYLLHLILYIFADFYVEDHPIQMLTRLQAQIADFKPPSLKYTSGGA
jgi:hypothetical protein